MDLSVIDPQLLTIGSEFGRSGSQGDQATTNSNLQSFSRTGRKRKATQALTESLESATRSDREMIALSKQIENNSSPKEYIPAKPKHTSIRKQFERYALQPVAGVASHIVQKRGATSFIIFSDF